MLRESLSAAFLDLGPQAPTILPGWEAAQLLSHLLLRERYPHLQIGRMLPSGLGRGAAAAVEQLEASPWQEQVELLRNGPPRLSPVAAVDRLSNDSELLIHREDLLRAQPDREPQPAPAELQAQAWQAVGPMARVAMRVRADVILVSPLGGRRLPSRRGDASVRVHGEPIELLLWVSGRDRAARVRVHGDQAGLAALREGRRGL